MAIGYFTSEQDPMTYDGLQRRRALAEALMQQGGDGGPVRSWAGGLNKVAQSLLGAYHTSQLDKEDKALASEWKAKAEKDSTYRALMGLGPLGSSGASPAMTASGGATTGGGAGRQASFSGSQGDFVSSMLPHAQKIAEETGLDPRLIIAQSALETGYGKSAPGNNYFGIKSHGAPNGQTLATTENVNGQNVATQDSFRTYGDMGESAKGYADFLKSNPRYREVLGAQGLDAQIAAMARSGYATDPMYGNKLRQIASGIQMPTPAPVQMAQAGNVASDGIPPGPVPSDAPPMAYAPAQQAIAQASPPMPTPRPMGLGTPPAASGAPAPNAAPAGPAPMPAPTGGIAPSGLLQLAMDPRFSPQQRDMAMKLYQMNQREEGVTTVDLGDRVAVMDKRGRVTGYMPKSRDSADWEPIKDSDGNVIGSFNKRTSETKPLSGQGGLPQPSNEVELADGTKIPIPQGDKGVFRKKIQEENVNVIASAPKSFSNLERAYKNATELENHPGLKGGPFNLTGATGMLGGITTQIRGTDAYKVQARIDELLGGTFLQAYDALRGGGQITQIEGDKAQAAMSRLGKPGVGPEEYAAAVKEFKDAVRSGMEKLKRVKGMDDPRYKLPDDKPAASAKPSAPAAPMQGWSVEVIP